MENEGLKVFNFLFSVFRKTAGLLLVTGLGLANSTALEWSAEGGHRWAKLADPGNGKPGFTLMPPETDRRAIHEHPLDSDSHREQESAERLRRRAR